ncbi:GatB/YqeY domain-containing protein [Permianibacter sp. IMCC34836]|uniref:GatB/YqeY domain-containing protein n=1 Tax=Permianibacter fluminis TaxID=2738515 RepID=UPI001552997A|nr:GatB/YqeY domain-containing protein [Permianibacter fluminis]NQD36399.1 GatB/YqeY domain-containing protein [Permianibacter fluminis]
MTSLRDRITEDMKTAMRAQDKQKLGTIRLLQSAIKQQEVDNRITLDDTAILAVVEKAIKQRRESIKQYEIGGRADLVAVEQAELEVLQAYLPEQLGEAELSALIVAAIAETGAASVKDMGKVMNLLKPKVQGRCDMGAMSGLIKAKLGG